MSVNIHIQLEEEKDALEAVNLLKVLVGSMNGADLGTDPEEERAYPITEEKRADPITEKKEDPVPEKTLKTEPSEEDEKKKEKLSEKQVRRKKAMARADELGVPYTNKMGTATIEKRVAAAEGESEKEDTKGSEDGDKSKTEKKGGKKAPVYDEKKTKELCVKYINELPGTTEEKKEALYKDILVKYGDSTKMSEIAANGNCQIVGEVLAAHLAFWNVHEAVSAEAATGAVVLVANVTDLNDVPAMLHTALKDALDVVYKESQK